LVADPISPHGPLREIAPETWTVKGILPFPLHRSMAVFRLADKGLLLHSAVALSDEGLASLTSLGPPRILVVPHAKHSMDAAFYKRRFPDLIVVAPDDSKAEIESRRNVQVDGNPGDVLPAHGVRASAIPGIRYTEYAVEVPVGDRWGLMVTDALYHGKGSAPESFGGRMMSVTGTPGGGLGVSRLFRWMMTRDRSALRAWLAAQAERDDLAFVWMAHGDPVTSETKAELRRAVATL
jgi:hypothetical protein